MTRREWPDWWNWDLELGPHILKRMVDRGLSEIDLREMLEQATGCCADVLEERWVIETRHGRRRWAVIVEPDRAAELLVVVTAYPLEKGAR